VLASRVWQLYTPASMPNDVAPWIERMARVGYTAKGILYFTIGYLAATAALVGFFVALAALHHDPSQAGGVRQSLGALAQYGRWPFAAVSFGLIAYGVYELLNARYRSINLA
jgi:hypothetical protein